MLLGAYYYPWYGKPRHAILGGGEWASGYSNHPVLGEYDCRDARTIRTHLGWARDAGIDFLAFNWIGNGTWEDVTIRKFYLNPRMNWDLKFCIHYDSFQALNKLGRTRLYDLKDQYVCSQTKGRKLLEDFEYLSRNYFNHPQYLRIENRPVVIIYLVREYLNAREYFESVVRMLRERNIEPYFIADCAFWDKAKEIQRIRLRYLFNNYAESLHKLSDLIVKVLSRKKQDRKWITDHFSAITAYNMYLTTMTANFLPEVEEVYIKSVQQCRSSDLTFVPSIMPGYDDRGLSGPSRPILDRGAGRFYRDFWRMAGKYVDPSLPIMMITSFNEWHEGTEIEPSTENGSTYLELTRELKDASG